MCWGGHWRPHKLRWFSPLLTPLFHEHSHRVFGMLLNAISESCDTDFTGQVVYKPWVLSVSSEALMPISYFDTCSRLCAFAALACDWFSYHTFNVMVLKCTHYIPRITLYVSQTGCILASQLGFEPSSLVWRAGSLLIKPSGPATVVLPQRCLWYK